MRVARRRPDDRGERRVSHRAGRVGLFGGSFDPIHNGHILPVLAAREDLDLDVVHYLPTARPPHKARGTRAPALARNTMVELALLPYPELVVSDVELDLGRIAYTVDTVERYAAEDPKAELHLLLGVDSFNDLMSWRRFKDLIAAVRLVVLTRPGERGLDPAVRAAVEEARGFDLVRHRSVDVSSSSIRRRLARGEDVDTGLMPAAVLRYCRKYGLYR